MASGLLSRDCLQGLPGKKGWGHSDFSDKVPICYLERDPEDNVCCLKPLGNGMAGTDL